MGVLEQVSDLKKRGLSDSEIITNMQQQGASPKEIETALDQANIKNAVSRSQIPQQSYDLNQPQLLESLQQQSPDPGLKTTNIQGEDYYPSGFYEQQYIPSNEPYQAAQEYYQPQVQPQQEYSQEQYLQNQNYQEPLQEDYYPSNGLDSETMTEIAEQIVQEKINDIKFHIDGLNEFKSLSKSKLEHMESRLHAIEQTIDKLQLAILEKVGSYLSSTEGIKKEMSMMQDSFSKVMNPEVLHKHKHHEHSTYQENKPQKKTIHIVHHKAKTSKTDSSNKSKKKRI